MAQLNINQRQAGDVTILDLNGEVRIGDSSTALRGAIKSLVAGGNQKILLNLAGVKYIDSSGIGELIANYTTVGRSGGQLKLLNLTEKVQDLLVITKLLTVFDVYDHESEALSSFK
jgi:anti-sigma B factor antagonist